MPSLSPILAVIELSFDPVAQIGDWLVRIQTIALAVVVFVGLVLAAFVARRTPADVGRPADDGDEDHEANHLRRDDLLFIAVAALPGAVLGGRIGYALIHLDYYRSTPGALIDISQGGLELSLAVVGGTLTAAIVASLLGAPVGRWMHALIVPLLLGIAGGKLVMILGGEGQGVPFDGPWATAYLGPGPWLSLAPAVPSHPSQAYEGIATIVVMAVLLALLARGSFGRMTGGAFLVGLALWALARLGVAFSWRDPQVLGPLSADQLIAITIAAGSIVVLGAMAGRSRLARRRGASADAPASVTATPARAPAPVARRPDGEPDWPDPTTRPRI